LIRPARSIIALLALALFAASPLAFAAKDCSFLYNYFAKEPLIDGRFESLSDLGAHPPELSQVTGKVLQTSTEEERRKAIELLPIADVTAAPGHRTLRNPAQVDGLVKHIQETGGQFSHDPLLINVITDAEGNPLNVDLWNAHHRLVAYLKAGYKTLGDIDPKNIQVLVNGKPVNAEHPWGHFLSVGSVDVEKIPEGAYSVVPPGGDIRVGTISVAGNQSNHGLGSRNSIRQLYANTFQKQKPKVGVIFGTFDPFHEGHLRAAKDAAEEMGLDEVVVIVNWNSIEKPNATDARTRLKILEQRLRSEPKINLYIGDSSQLIDKYSSREPLIERIAQTYGTQDLYQVIGEDSYRKLLEQGNIKPGSKRKYLVLPRSGDNAGDIPLPDDLKGVVTISKSKDEQGTSSTKIRKMVKEGKQPDASELHPDSYRLIQELKLYQ
jgi:nicotinate-nucleotide adenylyltransferase